VTEQGAARILRIMNQAERCNGGTGEHRRRCGRVDKASRSVADQTNRGLACRDERACNTERLTEGPNDEVWLDAGGRSNASTVWPEHSEGMRFVDEKAGVEGMGQLCDLNQWRCHAVHRKERIGDHERAPAFCSMLLEQGREIVGASVCVDVDFRAGESTAVDEARMVERVAEDDVAWTDERLNGADVGGVAGREERGRRSPEEVGKCVLGLPVGIHSAGDQTRCGCADPIDTQGALRGRRDGRMAGEAQIVVRTEAEDRLSVDHDFGALTARDSERLSQETRSFEFGEGFLDLAVKAHCGDLSPAARGGQTRLADDVARETSGTLRLFFGMLHVKQSELEARARVGLEGILNRL